MTETNAQDIRFALVDEAGHLTGKPAEGVAAAIRKALESLPQQPAGGGDDWQGWWDSIQNQLSSIPQVAQASPRRISAPEDFPVLLKNLLDAVEHIASVGNATLGAVWLAFGGYPFTETYMEDFLALNNLGNQVVDEYPFGSEFAGSRQELIIYAAIVYTAYKIAQIDKIIVEGDTLKITAGGRTGSVPIQWDA